MSETKPKTKPICSHCKSDEVKADSYSSWNADANQWETEEVYDKFFCRKCEGECSVVWASDIPHKILTKDEQIEYVREGYGSCPYCGDPDISGGSWECEDNTVWQQVTCSLCDRVWKDVYELSNIDQEDEAGDTVPGGLTSIDPWLMHEFDVATVLEKISDHCQKEADRLHNVATVDYRTDGEASGTIDEAERYARYARFLRMATAIEGVP